MGGDEDTLNNAPDPHAVYVSSCKILPEGKTVILVGSQRVEAASELFYVSVLVSDQCTLRGMLDSGSMSCTLSEDAESKLRLWCCLRTWCSLAVVDFSHNLNVSVT